MKFLIVRFSAERELLLSTALIRCIRAKYPNAQIHYLVADTDAHILKNNPHIDEIITFSGDLRDMIVEFVQERYDYLIDLQNNFRTWQIGAMLSQAANSDITVLRLSKYRLRGWLANKFGVNFLPDKNLAVRYLSTVKKIGVVNDGQGLDYAIPEEDVIASKDLPMSHSAGYVSFVIGASATCLNMDLSWWQELCKRIDYPIILQGGEADVVLGEKLKELDPIRIYNSCGKFNFNEGADIIKYAKVVVGTEHELTHLAAAFKRKIVTITNKASIQKGYYPYYGYNNLKSNLSADLKIIEAKSNESANTPSLNTAVSAVTDFLKKK